MSPGGGGAQAASDERRRDGIHRHREWSARRKVFESGAAPTLQIVSQR
jgi:hypothetical protein